MEGDALEQMARDALAREDHGTAALILFEGYGPEIFSWLHDTAQDPKVADDVFSIVSEELWRGLRASRRRSSLRIWLYALAWSAYQRWRCPSGSPRRPA